MTAIDRVKASTRKAKAQRDNWKRKALELRLMAALASCDHALTEMMRTRKHGWIQDAAHKEAQAILSQNPTGQVQP